MTTLPLYKLSKHVDVVEPYGYGLFMEGLIIGCQCVCNYVMYMIVSNTLSTSYHLNTM